MESIITTVIGDGNAFSDNNSSFYIEVANGKTYSKKILFDCGYSIFQTLKKHHPIILKEMEYVYISHMDDDHIGSLKTLLYYRYFILGLKTKILCNYALSETMHNYLKNLTYEIKSGREVYAPIFEIRTLNELGGDSQVLLKSFPVNHIQPCYGLCVSCNGYQLYITADTKADYKIEEFVDNNTTNYDNMLIFHDYSPWNVPSRQVHACDSDIAAEYSQKFQDKIIKYHFDDAGIKNKIYTL